VAEAPRVVAYYESAFLARLAETGKGPESTDDLIFEIPESKWFTYSFGVNADPDGVEFTATAGATMGKFVKDNQLLSKYKAKSGTTGDCFAHSAKSSSTVVEKMIPNFFNKTGVCSY